MEDNKNQNVEGQNTGNPSVEDQNPEPSTAGTEDKTFTQDQVNAMIAAEKRKNMAAAFRGLGFESEDQAKEFIEKYQKQEEQNKSDLVKEKERADKLEAEKKAEAAKALDLQYKFDAISEGCDSKAADDVVVLAKAKMSDGKDFASALKEVKEQYPAMFGQSDNRGTGSGGTSPRPPIKAGDLSGMGKRLAEARRQGDNTAKENDYFKR